MSHYKRYPAYKDSGAEWLRQVPEHWTVSRISAVFRERNERGGEKSELLAVSQQYGVIPQQELMELTDRRFSASESDDWSKYRQVHTGDIVYNKMRMWQGAVGRAPKYGIVSPAYVVLAPSKESDSRFYQYLFKCPSFISEAGRYSQGLCDDMNSCRYEDFKYAEVVVPTCAEQQAIAGHLDRETARIDALVEKKTRFIELLREKRQALITHAVTKGLDPNVKMKDTGAELLGEVPEHWTVSRLGHFASVENGSTPSRENPNFWENGTVPWLGSGEVNQVQVTEATELITELALRTCSLRLLPKETVVVGMVGQGKTRGLAAILKIDAAINQNLAAICSGPRLKPMFMLFFFGAAYTWIRESGRGSNQAALNCELLSEIRLALPPMNEQEEIVRHLVTNGERIDALIEKTERSIEFLKERRSALITAAVTGQIDLREAV